MESNLKSARGWRTIGAGAGVMIVAVAALLSGCYYRGRSPEYGGRGYGYHDHGHEHDHDHDRDRR